MSTTIDRSAPSLRTRYKKEYDAWYFMKHRCYNSKSCVYARYGARGIGVCERWQNSFENFLEDMGPRPGDDYSLDRINNDGNYEPGNCRWTTRKRQQANTSQARNLTFNGITQPLSVWARQLGISAAALRDRLKRRPLEEAITFKRKHAKGEFNG